MQFKPHDYQNVCVEHILDNQKSGLILDMGLGKTVSTLTALNALIFEELEVSKVLVIAPLRVARKVWTDEIKKWDHLKNLRVSKIIGTPKQRIEALKKDADIYLISRDSVAWLCGYYGGVNLPFDTLIVDESSSFKNPKAVRFKALKKVCTSFDRVVILTGTPAPNSLLEIWPQVYLLDQGERLGRSVGVFREKYFKPNQRNGHIVYNYKIRDNAESSIYNRIGDICISMKAVDYLDMPDLNVVDLTVDLPPPVLERYKDFERDLVLEFIESEEVVTAANAAALANKLLQFANGAIYDEERNVINIHDEKLDEMAEIMEQLGGRPLICAWSYRHDLARIKKRFKKLKLRELKTDKDVDDWNAGEIDILLMHPASGGHGLNLQKGGHDLLWFGNTWSLELYQQLNTRIYRQGQGSGTVNIYRLISSGTYDTRVIESLSGKTENQDTLIDAIKAVIDKHR